MRGFLLISSEDEINELKKSNYYGLRAQIENKSISECVEKYSQTGEEPSEWPSKDKYTVETVLESYLDSEWNDDIKNLPYSEEPAFREAIKKDILCLVLLTCDYWKSKKKSNKKDWMPEKNICDIDWKVDFEFQVSGEGMIVKTDALWLNLKHLVIQESDIWNKNTRSSLYETYKPENIRNYIYESLSAEEKYMYQSLTGYPMAISLFERKMEKKDTVLGKKVLSDDEESILIQQICSIKGVHVRRYYIENIFNYDLCEGEEAQSRQINLKSFLNWNNANEASKNFEAIFQNSEPNIKPYREIFQCLGTNETIGEYLLKLYRGFLKVLVGDWLVTDKRNMDNWAEEISSFVRRDYSSVVNSDEFWIGDDDKIRVNEISREISGDKRNKGNKIMCLLQKQVMDWIIGFHSSISDKTGTPVSFPSPWDFDNIVFAEGRSPEWWNKEN
ncbi:hypothetical protein [Clostridium transplantifaecale]|uniref:hypothetical protein n=1 Tax=Clostridium transplantifaecale TaxID=2479838 RepID=UPI000F64070D|nr:hypothetical protein [Clostridium transplantifaecale]